MIDKQIDTIIIMNKGFNALDFKSLKETFNPSATIAISKKILVMISNTFIRIDGSGIYVLINAITIKPIKNKEIDTM